MNLWLITPLSLLLIGILLALAAARRKIAAVRLAWMLAVWPAAAFACLAWLTAANANNNPLTLSYAWLPSLNLSFSLYLDGLSALFALLITGIGSLVTIYSGYYFEKDDSSWRFQSYLLTFMAAMLGLVLAGDVITLFIFWEGTSLTSFLLIAYKTSDEEARRGAFKALFITGGGGIAMLAGLLFIGITVGDMGYASILSGGDVLRNHPFYPAMLGLIAFGAFTKSAQAPAHIWLPQAMTAPTPASAFLHSATMVKAGVYLLARLNPALGFTDLWFWLLSLFGLATMITGAYLGFKQNDLKALLAYSTISQLGALVALIGQDTEIAFKALVISILAHALYKSALFLTAGIVDHETGSRDLRRLGGLARAMPFTATAATISGLSMSGLPPLFGFLAKETQLATSVHPGLPPILNVLFPLVVVAAGALLLGQGGLFVYDVFFKHPADPKHPVRGHEPRWGMWLAPMIPAIISLAVGVLPEPEFLATFLAHSAAASYGSKVKVSLALWSGVNIPLFLSAIAVSTGSLLFIQRKRIRPVLQVFLPQFSFNHLYDATLRGGDALARQFTRLQNGHLRFYLSIMLVALGTILWLFQAIPFGFLTMQPASSLLSVDGLALLRVFTLSMAGLSAFITIFLRRDLFAILALSVSGLAVAVWIALEPAPDVALVQIVVDLLATVILVLSLTRLPRLQREKAREFTYRQSRPGLLRDGLIALGSGLLVALLVYISLQTRPHESLLAPYFAQNAKPLAGAKDIVGAILVDFRGFDTFFEIVVFASAGLGIHMLLHYAARKAGDHEDPEPTPGPLKQHPVTGVAGLPTSPLLHLLAYALLPLAFLLAVVQLMYGHDQPGDGFTAGVFISLAIGSWYVIFGYQATKQRLPWLRSGYLIAYGLLLALINGLLGAWFGSGFMAPLNYGQMLNLPLPQGFYLSNAFIFEVAICLAVLGGATYILDNLGRPRELNLESDALLQAIQEEPTTQMESETT
ncbi:MAG: proton-conducting transporter membrane subunit [Anaerolineales bacterium]|nr:proton-conducting transporter membrane subunit [Anaerolineales bacterium]